eukprot:CAMPEP_0201278100 /NCGR_PEP_ID=MMETSP0853-20130426/59946_1 /ASSEMBLY_ACC=CAM_ASM_000640 /TAXON_ID=183588 /ORGANISM="Pseudo-nitzschia fraudulenta, Strain WWA7" /LENGTH=35 /DNA_ID= /DNA_START= /DNA_END= /DNA_ORIENTATION=
MTIAPAIIASKKRQWSSQLVRCESTMILLRSMVSM